MHHKLPVLNQPFDPLLISCLVKPLYNCMQVRVETTTKHAFSIGRFHDAELASQARKFVTLHVHQAILYSQFFSAPLVYAALNLVGLYHNSIIRRAAQAHAEENKTGPVDESTFNKYLKFWSSRSKVNASASMMLSVISYTQVLMEMAVLKKLGKRRQWELIASLEAIK